MDLWDLTERRSPVSLRGFLPQIISIAIILLSVTSYATAYEVQSRESTHHSEFFKRLERAGTIHVDIRSQPSLGDVVLHHRQVDDDSESSTTTSSNTASSQPSAALSVATTAATTPNPTTDPSPSPTSSSSGTTSSGDVEATGLPTPFDTSLGNNFTQKSCPTFFNTFLSNATFKSCLPVSLLLQNSMGFFQAARSATLLQATLDASCSASLAICSPMMFKLATDLVDDTNCGTDYKNENPIVMQAYAGLLAYEPLYNATCLQDPLTNNYCYSEAMVNATNPSDSYPYYTALGIPLPSSAQPSCSSCLQRTMSMFAGYARLKEQPISRTYLACASQVDSACGSTFADTQVKVASVSSSDAVPRLGLGVLPSISLLTAAVVAWQMLS